MTYDAWLESPYQDEYLVEDDPAVIYTDTRCYGCGYTNTRVWWSCREGYEWGGGHTENDGGRCESCGTPLFFETPGRL